MEKLKDEEIKIELRNMLIELKNILDENGFQYSIWAGTMLGAVRHKGFIPWDDDIDIAMRRYDYEKFLSFLKGNDELRKRFIGYELGKQDFPFIKFINPMITVQAPGLLDKNLWIDIFPIDNVPKNYISYFKRQRVLNKLYWANRKSKNFELLKAALGGTTKSIFYYVGLFIARLFPSETCVSMLIKNAKSCSEEKKYRRVLAVCGIFENEMFPVDLMDEYETIIFEGISVKVISRYKEWLEIRYGDYMTFPPKNERVNHKIEAYRE